MRKIVVGIAYALVIFFFGWTVAFAAFGIFSVNGGPSSYDGLAATRGSAPSGLQANSQAMARTASFTRSAVTQIKIITPNWYGPETAPGGTATLAASIEYPVGVCTQLKWSSATSVSIPNGGQVTSDYVSISIPTNTQFWIREYFTGAASGVPVDSYQGRNASLGDALVVGNSGVTDQTVSCTTVVDGGTSFTIAPLAIVSPITAPSICILGDSIAIGVDNDHTPNSNGDNGIIAPSIGGSFGYSNMGVNADTAAAYISSHTNRNAVLPYCSHVIVEYGSNDLYLNGESVATLEANLTTIYGYAAGKTVFQNSLIARTCSTDNWATTANQQAYTGSGAQSPCNANNFEALRVSFNSDLTSATFGPNGGFFDPQSVIGTSTNNSIWKAGGSFTTCNPWTNDGVHPNTCSYYTVLQSSGYIDTSRIHRP